MKILVATDGSTYSFLAVEKACEMVIDPAADEIRIISVYRELASLAAEPLEISAESVEQLENISRLQATGHALKAQEIIERHFAGREVRISMTAVRGSPREKILDEAERWKPDLIVVGSLGRNFLSRVILGSVSAAVVRHAGCSVLVVRAEPAEE